MAGSSMYRRDGLGAGWTFEDAGADDPSDHERTVALLQTGSCARPRMPVGVNVREQKVAHAAVQSKLDAVQRFL